LLLADCCYSGGLIDELKRRKTKLSYACVTSAYSHNTSTGEWTFTQSLYQGLQGDTKVDKDGDRIVSLSDFSKYAELEMALIEEQKSMFYTTNNFNPQMLKHGATQTKAAVAASEHFSHTVNPPGSSLGLHKQRLPLAASEHFCHTVNPPGSSLGLHKQRLPLAASNLARAGGLRLCSHTLEGVEF
jgi:hypothetical protein